MVVSPHNTALFEFTGESASRNHIFLYTATDEGDIQSAYLFRTFDPETYETVRQHIATGQDYEVTLDYKPSAHDEQVYQQEIDYHVESWRNKIPDTVMDFLITTALK